MTFLDRLNHAYRVLATGFCFSVFFFFGILFRFVACPFLMVTVRNPSKRPRKARAIVQKSFALFMRLTRFLGVLTWEIEGAQELRRPGTLLCPSHPTLLDVVLLMSYIPNANCLVKSALKHSFALSAPVATTGYIANDEGSELIEAAATSLRNGDCLIIFPEGTRTKPGKEPHLQHGAAATALLAKCNVTPVKITCTPPSLAKGVPWYRVPERKMRFSVQVKAPISIEPFLAIQKDSGRPIAVRRLSEALKKELFPEFSTNH